MNKMIPICLLAVFPLALAACSDGGDEDCRPNDHTLCRQGEVYWVDACGVEGNKAADCDCGCNADFTACKEPCDCTPDCEGRVCGPNGCGGSCPPGCALDESCNETSGQCESNCEPDCEGKDCGPDGCDGTCPPGCSNGQSCNETTGQCEGECVPDCVGRCCGDDGCEGTCPDECAAEGQSCNTETCFCEGGCLSDCGEHDCGVDCDGNSCGTCGQGFFCRAETQSCVEAGLRDCWDGMLCSEQSPYCLFSCREQATRCCPVQPDHPMQADGVLDDSCEVCCQNPDYPHPVIWPDGEPACCAAGMPYPYAKCETGEHQCCPSMPQPPRLCDGSIDPSCVQCCTGDSVPVRYPDGLASCCPPSSPYPCLSNGAKLCCPEAGGCG